MTKKEMIEKIINCRYWEGTRDVDFLTKQSKEEIQDMYWNMEEVMEEDEY
jgi:hypothetical protein